jgi:hypothetical protein
MPKTLELVSVKCIKPSSGINSLAQGIFGAIGAIIGGAVAVAGAAVTGGILIAATGLAVGGGAATGVNVINGLDNFFSGSDDLYINVNGGKIWPSGKYKDIDSQQTKNVGYKVPLTSMVTIQLWEYDTVGSDDLLGYLDISPDHQTGNFTYLVQNEDEGSIYEINMKVAE